MNKICGIYKITSPTGKIYIGQSINIKRRISEHKRIKPSNDTILAKSILKYGWDAHVCETIHECDESLLNDLEKYYIKLFNTFNTEHGMNLTEGGDYTKMSEETKQKMKLSRENNNFWLGHKHSEESKAKMSESAKGNKNNLGTYYSEESRNKIGISHQGKKVADTTKQAISKTLSGRKLSDNTKRKIGDANKGKKYPGRILDEKTKQKISASKLEKNYAGTYEIYDSNNNLFARFNSNIKTELKKLNLPRDKFCNSYRNNEKIKRGIYKNWYVIKIN